MLSCHKYQPQSLLVIANDFLSRNVSVRVLLKIRNKAGDREKQLATTRKKCIIVDMKLMTPTEIVEALTARGVSITREQFNYYAKIGLLFVPDKKIKPRVNAGMQTYYAEEHMDILTDIFRYKGAELTLKEIEGILLNKDRERLLAIYKDANMAPKLQKQVPSSFYSSSIDSIKLKVLSWRKAGYYRGLLTIYADILDKLNITMLRIKQDQDVMADLSATIIKQLKDQEDRYKVRDITDDKQFKLSEEYQSLFSIRGTLLNDKYNPLQEFLAESGIE